MNWPQVILGALLFVGLGLSLANHGKPREPTNFWLAAIGTALCFGLLWWGGFFSSGGACP